MTTLKHFKTPAEAIAYAFDEMTATLADDMRAANQDQATRKDLRAKLHDLGAVADHVYHLDRRAALLAARGRNHGGGRMGHRQHRRNRSAARRPRNRRALRAPELRRLTMLDFMYESRDRRDAAIFAPLEGREGARICPPGTFQHGTWALVAELDAQGDGKAVRIFESRMPARFFKLEAQAGGGIPSPGFAFSTGSGDDCGKLIVAMAIAISEGMLDIDKEAA